MIRTTKQSAAIWSLVKRLGINDDTRKDLIAQVSAGRTDSSSQLSEEEAKQLISHLTRLTKNASAPAPALNAVEESKRKMRGKIIHYLLLMGYGKPGVESRIIPNWDRINPFIMNIGVNNPDKKALNKLSYEELCAVTTQVEAMYAHDMKRAIKRR